MKITTFALPLVIGAFAAAAVSAAPLPGTYGLAGTHGLVTLAQAKQVGAKKVSKALVKKKVASNKKRRVRRSFASLTCSVEATKKGLKGAKRKAYRYNCLRAASDCVVSAKRKGLKGRARTTFRKQCITLAARKATA